MHGKRNAERRYVFFFFVKLLNVKKRQALYAIIAGDGRVVRIAASEPVRTLISHRRGIFLFFDYFFSLCKPVGYINTPRGLILV